MCGRRRSIKPHHLCRGASFASHLEAVAAFEGPSHRREDQRMIIGYQHLQRCGTGLGLTIVRELTHMMNGEITVESEQRTGSTFTCVVPFAPARGS